MTLPDVQPVGLPPQKRDPSPLPPGPVTPPPPPPPGPVVSWLRQQYRQFQATQPYSTASPTSPDEPLNAVIDAFNRYGEDPAFANDIQRRWWATMSSPEVIMSVYSEVSGMRVPELDPSAGLLQSMYAPVLGTIDMEQVDRTLASRPLVADWWQRHTNDFSSEEKQIIGLALASDRKSVV